MKGIRFDKGKHSYYDLDAILSARNIGYPQKKTAEESVPFSSHTYDFTELYGAAAYGERQLQYTFTLMAENRLLLQEKLDALVNWLFTPVGKIPLYDDQDKGYHYMAKCTAVSNPEFSGCSAAITATFRASPFRIPDNLPNPHTGHYPDVNGDGTVDATDAALILEAAGRLGAGEASGLTPDQEAIADADLDGAITATDAAIVSEFAALTGVGTYQNNAAGWAKFMQERQAQQKGVI